MLSLDTQTHLGKLTENQYGEKYLFAVNHKNFETIDYQTLFNQEFKKTFEQKNTLCIITGTDSGLMVKQLLKNPIPQGTLYVFIEFPEIIELTKSQYTIFEKKGEPSQVMVTTAERWLDELEQEKVMDYFRHDKVEQLKSFAAQYLYIKEYLSLSNYLEKQLNQLKWKAGILLESKIFIQNQLKNLTENSTPAYCLKDYFKGKSALILAGGPSLDNYIEWIENNQQHYVVIAVSRIAKQLLKTKIKADIFVSIDPNPQIFTASNGIFEYDGSCIFVHYNSVSPLLAGNWQGINLYLGDLFPWETALNSENLTGIGPTVTNTAILQYCLLLKWVLNSKFCSELTYVLVQKGSLMQKEVQSIKRDHS